MANLVGFFLGGSSEGVLLGSFGCKKEQRKLGWCDMK